MSEPFNPAEGYLGGYHPRDGTVEFFGRIRGILEPSFTVLDLGAGRGSWYFEDQCELRRKVREMKGKVKRVIGLDVDSVVMDNPTTDENGLIENGVLPLKNDSVDVIISDYVLEHIENVEDFFSEVDRVLKPGGYFFARTPHSWNYVSLMARLIRNDDHAEFLKTAQPNRKPEDVFPTYYRLNTRRQISRVFKGYENYSYLYRTEPAYYFGSKTIYKIAAFGHMTLPSVLVANLFVMLRKRETA